MRRDRDDGDFFFSGSVIPENPVGSGRAVFRVGFEHILAIGPVQIREFMRIEARMARVGGEIIRALFRTALQRFRQRSTYLPRRIHLFISLALE